MDANEYQKLASRTLIDRPGFVIPDGEIMMVWNALGLVGEAGEVAENIKKGVFHEHGIDKWELEKELGDCLWYIAALCTKQGLSLSKIMEMNIEKLKERYPNGFTSADSKARVDVRNR